MNLLSIVSNENPTSIALSYLGNSTQYFFPDGKKVAETLADNFRIMLKFLGCSLKDIDSVAVIIGPGSYTGLRVGMAFAKAIVQFTNKNLYAVDAIEVLKFKNEVMGNIPVFPVIDARGGRCFIKDNNEFFVQDLDFIKSAHANSFIVGTGIANSDNRELTQQDILNAEDLEQYVMEHSENLENFNSDSEKLAKLLPIYVQEARIG